MLSITRCNVSLLLKTCSRRGFSFWREPTRFQANWKKRKKKLIAFCVSSRGSMKPLSLPLWSLSFLQQSSVFLALAVCICGGDFNYGSLRGFVWSTGHISSAWFGLRFFFRFILVWTKVLYILYTGI